MTGKPEEPTFLEKLRAAIEADRQFVPVGMFNVRDDTLSALLIDNAEKIIALIEAGDQLAFATYSLWQDQRCTGDTDRSPSEPWEVARKALDEGVQ